LPSKIDHPRGWDKPKRAAGLVFLKELINNFGGRENMKSDERAKTKKYDIFLLVLILWIVFNVGLGIYYLATDFDAKLAKWTGLFSGSTQRNPTDQYWFEIIGFGSLVIVMMHGWFSWVAVAGIIPVAFLALRKKYAPYLAMGWLAILILFNLNFIRQYYRTKAMVGSVIGPEIAILRVATTDIIVNAVFLVLFGLYAFLTWRARAKAAY
jgi:hypothetical protein